MARPKKQVKLKEPIKIRLKSLADGNKSIYLDIYWKGVRKYEYLKLYIIPEVNPLCKEQNQGNDGSRRTYQGRAHQGSPWSRSARLGNRQAGFTTLDRMDQEVL